MRIVIRYQLVLVVLSFACLFLPEADAAFSLNKTRVVVSSGSSSAIEVINHSPLKYGMQSWVEEVDASAATLAVTPGLLAIEGDSKATLRILSFDKNSASEQLFYLNVQEIPPVNTNSDTSTLSLAVRTRIKLFVRPDSLFEGRPDAEENIQVLKTSKGTLFRNPTDYYFSISKVQIGSQNISLPQLGAFAPHSEIIVKDLPLTTEIVLNAIDDYGATNSYKILVEE
ncbi:Gram-negative pili assembly chaperone, C-terminal domain protein [Vibrio owensii]|uniref:Gram-negative pili assembly chaperone, C-terminal domain protein n=1 Tax=Vibrio owensii TaxID=696485 RepID=A0AAU9QBG3_9VIBR|nr:Gram-negative pili assembly chaperone, C-terminal domain protein [Vibrio owensii]